MTDVKSGRAWYHGGSRIHDWAHYRWDRDRTTSDGNAEGPGMYWTSDPVEAQGYLTKIDPVLYVGTLRSNFRLMPRRKPRLADLIALYEYAESDSQVGFLSDWNVEDHPPSRADLTRALTPYAHQATLFDAYVTLYHDLFRYDANAYVAALRGLGFDGYVIPRVRTGDSRRRRHLVLWNARAMDIHEA